jgi:hypothetical protein
MPLLEMLAALKLRRGSALIQDPTDGRPSLRCQLLWLGPSAALDGSDEAQRSELRQRAANASTVPT